MENIKLNNTLTLRSCQQPGVTSTVTPGVPAVVPPAPTQLVEQPPAVVTGSSDQGTVIDLHPDSDQPNKARE